MFEIWLDTPDQPGWWAFKGSDWESVPIYMVDGIEYREWQEEWTNESEEYWDKYELELYPPIRYENVPGEFYTTIVEVKWVYEGMSISAHKSFGPHRGDRVLGFTSTRNGHDGYINGIDKVVGKWALLHIDWHK